MGLGASILRDCISTSVLDLCMLWKDAQNLPLWVQCVMYSLIPGDLNKYFVTNESQNERHRGTPIYIHQS